MLASMPRDSEFPSCGRRKAVLPASKEGTTDGHGYTRINAAGELREARYVMRDPGIELRDSNRLLRFPNRVSRGPYPVPHVASARENLFRS